MKWLFYLVIFCVFTRLEEIVDRKNGKEWYDSDRTQDLIPGKQQHFLFQISSKKPQGKLSG